MRPKRAYGLILAALVGLPLIVGPAPMPIGAATAEATTATTSWNTTLNYSASGAAGEWLFLFHEIPQPLPTTFTAIIKFNMSARAPEGDPYGVVLARPSVVSTRFTPCCDTRTQPLEPVMPLDTLPVHKLLGSLYVYDHPMGGEFSSDLDWIASFTTHGSGVEGWAMLVGSTAPWRFDLDIQFVAGLGLSPGAGSNVTVGPSFVSRGVGASFHFASELRLLEVPGSSYKAGRLTTEFTYDSPGWTHFQINGKTREPIEVAAYNYAIAFPSNFYHVGPHAGDRVRHSGLALEPIVLRAVGTMMDSPGTLMADVTHVSTTALLSVRVVHLPMAPHDLPTQMERWAYACRFQRWEDDRIWGDEQNGCLEQWPVSPEQPI